MTEREQQGIEYLASLGQLLTALTEAQAGAAQGRPTGQEALELAVVTVEKTDQRLGTALGTRQRWQDLSAKIDEVRRADTEPQAVYLAYTEATSLLFALYGAVRDNSDLNRDPSRDVFHLQEAVGGHLPMVVLQATRLIDLTVLAARARPPAPTPEGEGSPDDDRSGGRDDVSRQDAAAQERARAAAQAQAQAAAQAAAAPVAAAQATNAAVDELTDALKEAADNSDSRTLSSNLLGLLDRLRRAVDGIVLNTQSSAGAAAVPAARAELLTAAADITTTTLREMEVVLDGRLGELTSRDRLLLGTLVVAVILVLALAAMPVLAQRGRRLRPAQHNPASDADSDGTPTSQPGPPSPHRSVERPGGAGVTNHRYSQLSSTAR